MALPIEYNPGDLPQHYDSGSTYVASGVIKATPGKLNGILGYSSLATAQWIMLFDSATVPADTSKPKLMLYVSTNGTFSWDAGGNSGDKSAKFFSNGISWSNSTTAPTKTIGAANVWLSASYD